MSLHDIDNPSRHYYIYIVRTTLLVILALHTAIPILIFPRMYALCVFYLMHEGLHWGEVAFLICSVLVFFGEAINEIGYYCLL